MKNGSDISWRILQKKLCLPQWNLISEISSKDSSLDNRYGNWYSCDRFNSKDIHGAVRPIQIFTTEKYWILFRIVVDIGILRIRLNDQWLTMALMGGFPRIGNNEITILVNDAKKGSDIDPQKAQQALEIAEANLRKAEGKRQTIEANLSLRRART
ncbi:hypothetical protein GOBAR_AA11228 [Gossypium barbadense]|uniref:ATP synthase epsilon subunit C-terminal domain-containing protein n=1 Tax=Gossypium barbadense TaxID=3634 RepID=A0A2P5Y1E9_GOSBA|nr:hypothetical protein GOBAR_AA11228 [Gossypium barbadense]